MNHGPRAAHARGPRRCRSACGEPGLSARGQSAPRRIVTDRQPAFDSEASVIDQEAPGASRVTPRWRERPEAESLQFGVPNCICALVGAAAVLTAPSSSFLGIRGGSAALGSSANRQRHSQPRASVICGRYPSAAILGRCFPESFSMALELSSVYRDLTEAPGRDLKSLCQ